MDGSITIDTKLRTDGLINDLSKMSSSLKKAAGTMEAVGRSSTKAFYKAQDNIASANTELEKLLLLSDEMQRQKTNELSGLPYSKDELHAAVEAALSGDKAYTKLQGQIEKTEAKISKYAAEMQAAGNRTAAAKAELDELTEAMKRAEAAGGKIRFNFKKTTEAAIPLAKQVLTVGRMFKLMVLRMAIRSAVNAVRQGFRDLAQYSTEFNKSMSQLSTATLQMRNSLTAALAPALQGLLPIILSLVNAMTGLFNLIGMVSARVFGGASTFVKAKKAQVDYAKSVAGTNKALSGQVAAFDELNVLSQDQGGGASAGDMFETVEIPENIKSIGDLIRDNFDAILTTVLAIGAGILAWKIARAFGAGLKTALGAALALGGAVGFVKSAFDMLNKGVNLNNLTTMLLSVAAVAAGLFLVFGSVGAAIGLLVMGIAMLAIGLYDWIKNGEMSTATFWLLEAAIVAVGVAMAILLGWPALVVAALVAAGLAIYKNWESIAKWGAETWEKIKAVWSVAANWVKTTVADPMEKFFYDLWEGIKATFSAAWEFMSKGFKDHINGWIEMLEGFINFFIKAINQLIAGLNKISFSVPSWVPGIGGKSWGVNIASVPNIQIPRLATGAVIPPNAEFLAVLGDQKSGRNLEAPESLIRQIIREEMGDTGGRDITIKFDGNMSQLVRALKPYIAKEEQRTGRVLIQGT